MLEEVSSMDKKLSNRSVQAPVRGISTESKKPQDGQTNSKQVGRGCRMGSGGGSAGGSVPGPSSPAAYRFDQNRKSAPQKSKAVDKRPRPRGMYYGSRKENSQINYYQLEDEIGSIVSGGSKKKNLNHLLNFHYEPRGEAVSAESTRQQMHKQSYTTRALMATHTHKYNKEQFLQANCQFVVRSGGDYTPYMVDPDLLVDWDFVELIRVLSNEIISCPICLYPPVAGKITRCGHVFCWSCILHYLALSDKTWRKCPICYEAVHKNNLKSVESIERTICCVGQNITLQLMKREKGSLIATPVVQYDKRVNKPLLLISEESLETTYSKLLLAEYSDVLKIIGREQNELNEQLKECTGCPELCFVEEAVELLSKRRIQLEQSMQPCSSVTEEQIENTEIDSKIAIQDSNNKLKLDVNSDHSQVTDITFATDDSKETENQCTDECQPKIKPESDGRARYESLSSEGEEITNVTAEDLYIGTNQANNQPVKYYYFYQAIDGQQIYLHAINVRMLEMNYGSLENCPPTISGTVVEKEAGSMTTELRKRLRYLEHVPITCQFEVVELSLVPPIISEETYEFFQEQLEQRKRRREKRAREERRREKKIEESERRMLRDAASGCGGGRGTNLCIESFSHFPQCGLTSDDFPPPSPPDFPSTTYQQSADDSSRTSSPPLLTRQNSQSVLTSSIASLSVEEDATEESGPSFAQMLREGKTMRSSGQGWPTVGNRGSGRGGGSPAWGLAQRQHNTSTGTHYDDTDSYGIPPSPPQFSIAEMLQTAAIPELGHADSAGKKKKKKQKVLFSTGMACSGK